MELLTKNKLLTAVLAVLSVAGIGAYIFQLVGGLAVTGMSNGVSWGLYITMFMFFVGLSAGGLIVASSVSVFHIKRFKAVAMPAIILSTVCICLAGMFVLIDLGGIQRIWRIVTGPNPTSPLVWDICVITLYLVINVLYLVNMRRGNDHAVSIISRFALPCAILVHSVTAWIFGLQIAKEGWYSAIMAPIFVASAMDSGLALLLCVLAALKKARLFDTSRELMASLAGLLATCIAVDAFFIFCEVLTMAYPGAAGAETLALMTSGPTSPFFWFEIVGGLVVPFLVLVFAKNRERTGLVVGASVLVIAGVLCKRLWLLFTSFIVPNVEGAPGVLSDGGWALLGSYAPTVPEVLIVLGVVSVGEGASFVCADIPGLIEGAAEGVGLGHDFLRHVERCRLLLHVVDVSGCEGRDPKADFEQINHELAGFSAELADRPQIVLGNKCDIASPEQVEEFKQYVEAKGLTFLPISAATRQGVDNLPALVYNRLKDLPPVKVYEAEYKRPDKNAQPTRPFTVERTGDHEFTVDAPWLERILAGTNVEDYESLQYFQTQLGDSGILDELVAQGVEEEDTIKIGEYEFDYLY